MKFAPSQFFHYRGYLNQCDWWCLLKSLGCDEYLHAIAECCLASPTILQGTNFKLANLSLMSLNKNYPTKGTHAQTFSIVAMYTDFFLRLLRGGIFPWLAAYSSTKKPSSTAN